MVGIVEDKVTSTHLKLKLKLSLAEMDSANKNCNNSANYQAIDKKKLLMVTNGPITV